MGLKVMEINYRRCNNGISIMEVTSMKRGLGRTTCDCGEKRKEMLDGGEKRGEGSNTILSEFKYVA